jgi:hypothetical protein
LLRRGDNTGLVAMELMNLRKAAGSNTGAPHCASCVECKNNVVRGSPTGYWFTRYDSRSASPGLIILTSSNGRSFQ